MGLDELVKTVPRRQWLVAMCHLAGYDAAAIARVVRYTHAETGQSGRSAIPPCSAWSR